MKDISPEAVLDQVALAVPEEFRKNIIIVGSLAAGFHFFSDQDQLPVRTKDVDCVLAPRIAAVGAGEAIVEKLLAGGWTFRTDGEHGEPGNKSTPDKDLPVVRLFPPDGRDWFIEFLAISDPMKKGKDWMRMKLSAGHYGLCSFRFMALSGFRPIVVKSGLKYARPSMMALANLLEHPEIKPEKMSGMFENRKIKRSNKDLGRVLALALLSGDEVERWVDEWEEALMEFFPGEWKHLAARTGTGLNTLLEDDEDLDEAMHTCNAGLLSSKPVSLEQLRIIAERLLQDAIEPLRLKSR